jgi:hypothetical protein
MLVVQVATTVTPSGDLPDPTVHDEHNCARDPAACRGDVASTDQISVPCESTVRAVEIPSAWFVYTPLAFWAGRRAAPFADELHGDPCALSLITQRAE